ncbi:tyrosine-type recombinase/integrase [Listeria monocytogenes]|uniref:tyrosine-type recombinase/integrase n=1 Tax=Listeria monocytogenes TaxID=1639 RepID=UPI0011EB49DB|nr:tyrosine-type recombinase/integrase [Listeria monocytogenes]TYU82210.1 tyrosine-type recombinase/integrase [Listeria monocytogenes]
MATIKKYQKKDGSTAYMFNTYLGIDPLTGKSRRTTRRGFRTYKEAKLALSRLEFETSRVEFVKENKLTFKQVYEMWLEQHKLSVRDSTVENITKRFRNQIIPELGNWRIEKINTHICQQAVNKWAETVVAYPQIKSYASKVFDYAINNNIVRDNPMKRVLLPKKKSRAIKKEKDFYTRQELQCFFKCLEKENNLKNSVFFRLLAFTGARKGEIHALTWADIDLVKEKVTINKTLVVVNNEFKIHDTKTINGNRTLSLDTHTVKLLKSWKRSQKEWFLKIGRRHKKEQQLVFTNDTFRSNNEYLYLTYGTEEMKKLCKKYPEIRRIKTHGFRHTHASLLFESGASLKDVQIRLGHTDIKTTMDIYTHVTDEREETTAKKFAEYVNF